MYSRALEVPLDAVELPQENGEVTSEAPEWCKSNGLVVVIVTPNHTRAATTALLSTAVRHLKHKPQVVFMGILSADFAQATRNAERSALQCAKKAGLPISQVYSNVVIAQASNGHNPCKTSFVTC